MSMRGAKWSVGVIAAVLLSGAATSAQGSEPPVVTTLGANVQELPGGAGGLGSASILFEGPHWGLELSVAGFTSQSGWDSVRSNAVGLAAADLSYAILATPTLRLKLEVGLDSAHPDGASMFGPRGGISGKLPLLGPLFFEGALRVTARPYVHSEAFSGFALSFRSLALRAGYRAVVFDDQPALGESGRRREFAGWYGGLAFSL